MAGWNGNLPSTLEIMDVRNCLDVDSLDLGTLCSSEKVNPWSRYRPGYWYRGSDGVLAFQRPRGKDYSDPRTPPDPKTGLTKEYYCLHHFFGYNHSARPAGTNGGNSIAWYEPSGYAYVSGYRFELGEVNWNNDSSYNWWSFNRGDLSATYVALVLEYYDTSSKKWVQGSGYVADNTATMHGVLYKVAYSSSLTTVDPGDIKLKASSLNPGNEIKMRIVPYFSGNGEAADTRFPDSCIFYFTMKRQSKAILEVMVEEGSALATKFNDAAKALNKNGLLWANPMISITNSADTTRPEYNYSAYIDVTSGVTYVSGYITFAAKGSDGNVYCMGSANIKNITAHWEIYNSSNQKLNLVNDTAITIIPTKGKTATDGTTIFGIVDISIPQYYTKAGATSGGTSSAVLDGYKYHLKFRNFGMQIITLIDN